MPSNYPVIDFLFDYNDGDVVAMAGATVKVSSFTTHNATTGHDEFTAIAGTLTTDSEGILAAGTLATVPVGTRVRFRVENFQGASGFKEVVTT